MTPLVSIIMGSTSDLPVMEKACKWLDEQEIPFEVNALSAHRTPQAVEAFARGAADRGIRVIIAAAGMEGALASVVGGLADCPVIAVPTSVGYGASFGGLSALLSMLNSCASGVSVVNIDNGFGAAYQASMINHIGGQNANTLS